MMLFMCGYDLRSPAAMTTQKTASIVLYVAFWIRNPCPTQTGKIHVWFSKLIELIHI